MRQMRQKNSLKTYAVWRSVEIACICEREYFYHATHSKNTTQGCFPPGANAQKYASWATAHAGGAFRRHAGGPAALAAGAGAAGRRHAQAQRQLLLHEGRTPRADAADPDRRELRHRPAHWQEEQEGEEREEGEGGRSRGSGGGGGDGLGEPVGRAPARPTLRLGRTQRCLAGRQPWPPCK